MKILVRNNIIVLEFLTKKEMGLHFFRFSEFFESAFVSIKGHYFSIDDWLEAYSDEDGTIDYLGKWDGYNVPKHVISKFVTVFSSNLTTRETFIWNASKEVNESGYIIAYTEGDNITLNHELSHALFHSNLTYKDKATDIIHTISKNVLKDFTNHLITLGYCPEVIEDEIVAYLVAYDQDEFNECFPLIKVDDIQLQMNLLQDLFTEFNTLI